jgi:hypothetical protein
MEGYFVLDDGGEPVEEPDFAAWTRWFEQADRSVARTVVTPEVTVLTTFSGVDHSTQGEPPRLFETRVFGGVLDSEEVRNCTKADALAAHTSLVEWCRVGASPDCGVTEHDILQ